MCETDDDFVALLRDLHQRTVGDKVKAGLASSAHFDPALDDETKRGLKNIRHVRGIWLDNDGGDLTPETFAAKFPYLRMVTFNSYNHHPDRPRWRAFVPTSHSMTVDIHQIIMRQIEAALNGYGYWRQEQLDRAPRIKSRLRHGFDATKFNAASLFYLPAQARDPSHSFFMDYNAPPRGPLDVTVWLETAINKLKSREEAEDGSPDEHTRMDEIDRTAKPLRALTAVLEATRATSHAVRRDIVERAVDRFRQTPPGTGHAAYYRLALALKHAGLDDAELRDTLKAEARSSRSPKERLSEITRIMVSLRKTGRLASSRE